MTEEKTWRLLTGNERVSSFEYRCMDNINQCITNMQDAMEEYENIDSVKSEAIRLIALIDTLNEMYETASERRCVATPTEEPVVIEKIVEAQENG